MDIKEVVTEDIARVIGKDTITGKERAVLSILMLYWGKTPIKQLDIIQHPVWKSYYTGNGKPEAVMRGLRKIIRGLRVNHKIPILYNSEGHYLPTEQKEVDEFLERLEREVRRKSESNMETYKVLKDSLGVSSQILDKLDVSGVQIISFEKL